MRLSYTEIFKYSDVLNPISATSLLLAGKLARLGPNSVVLDLGSGKAFPSLLWASTFGAEVEGLDINKSYVDYANSRAEMLNLSHRAKYSCEDIKGLRLDGKRDVVAFLGVGIAHVYVDHSRALRIFRTMLHTDGFLILAEPAWSGRPVPPQVLEALGETESDFLTEAEMQRLMEESGFQVLGRFASSKEDWELYVRPVFAAMQEIIESKSDLADEARKVMDGFKVECDAVDSFWNMLLWVAKFSRRQ